MKEEDLQAMQARADAASPGPWLSWVEGRDHLAGSNLIQTHGGGPEGVDIELVGGAVADQDFIAAARSDLPVLIAEVRRLRGLLEPGG